MRQFSRNTTTTTTTTTRTGQLPHVAVLNSEKKTAARFFFFFTRKPVGMDMGVSGPSMFNQCRAVYESGTIHLGGRLPIFVISPLTQICNTRGIGYLDKIGGIDSQNLGFRPKQRERCSHVNYKSTTIADWQGGEGGVRVIAGRARTAITNGDAVWC